MNRVTRHHVDRRSLALDRLESITAGVAVAGAVGTIGFGALAALTFSGTTAAAAGNDATLPNVTGDGPGSDDDFNRAQPGTDDDGSQFFQPAPAPRSATGRSGHAATGGSG